MLLDLEFSKTRDHRENVTSIIEKLADRKDMLTPHDDDAKWADMFRNTVLVDDLNGGNELDKHLLIKARKTEMELFKKMAVYRKVPQLVKKRRAASTRTRDAAVSLEACRHGNQEGQASGSFLLVADCAKGQRQAKLLRSGIFGREQGVLLRAHDAASLHQDTR